MEIKVTPESLEKFFTVKEVEWHAYPETGEEFFFTATVAELHVIVKHLKDVDVQPANCENIFGSDPNYVGWSIEDTMENTCEGDTLEWTDADEETYKSRKGAGRDYARLANL